MKDNISIPVKYKQYEYLLVLNPHEELCKKIMQVKQDFFDKYQAQAALYGKPHITLVTLKQYEVVEERIVNRLKTIAMGYHPFKIELKDYGSFPSHTIYINITSKIPIQDLIRKIRTETQRLMKFDEDNKPHFITEPYLIIARKLLAWQYEKGWLEYSHRQFTGRFIADGMLLLKRYAGDMKYQVIQRFEFQNLAVDTTQGNLFK
jgi:2'-5' RNA ligase